MLICVFSLLIFSCEDTPYAKKITVTFDANNGTEVSRVEIEAGTKVPMPENPVKDGYKFVEWQLNGKSFDFDKAITEDITLTATWFELNVITIGDVQYKTLSSAIENAKANDVILIGEGEYSLPVIDITIPLTIKGDAIGKTVLNVESNNTESTGLIKINAEDVKIEGIDIKASKGKHHVIFVNKDNFSLINSAITGSFTDIENDPVMMGVAIAAHANKTSIDSCVFTDCYTPIYSSSASLTIKNSKWNSGIEIEKAPSDETVISNNNSLTVEQYKGKINFHTIENASLTAIATLLDTNKMDINVNGVDITKTYVATARNTEDTARVAYKDGKEFSQAVYNAIESKTDNVVEVHAKEINLSNAHNPEINGSVTINANGADFKNKDFAIYTYNNDSKPIHDGNIEITVNDARDLYIWGQPDAKRGDKTTINIILNNIKNTGTGRDNDPGRLIYLTGTKGITNITLNNCSVESSDSPVYKNASGDFIINNCSFKTCAVPINLNYKATSGEMNVVIDNCTFDDCGSTGAGISTYAAPIRVVHTVEGSTATVTITNTSITNTVGTKGDVLLVDDRNGNVILPLTAKFAGNKTDLQVLAEKGEEFIVVKANETKELIAGTKPNTVTQ